MRILIAALIGLVAAALVCCALISSRSDKEIAPKVTGFLISLLPPVVGNLIIIIAHTEGFSLFGRYLYAVGIDITMYCLLDFTLQYCGVAWNRRWHGILKALIALDIAQLLCNPFFGHAFAPERMTAYGEPYYNVKSYFGRTAHLGLVYLIMGAVLIVLLIRMVRSAKIYSEKYSIMFVLLLLTGVWELFYLSSRTPVKQSVIAYGVFGLLVFYFSLYYRPLRLLDHLLADVASGLADGLFLFDGEGKCMWADEHGMSLTGGEPGAYSTCPNRLEELFPGLPLSEKEWKERRSLEDKYYSLEMHTVSAGSGRVIGSVLSLQDETENELALQHERYIANHDPLTGIYTKKCLFDRTRERIDANPDETFYVAYMDINNFKFVNDVFGQEFGDFALQTVAHNIRMNLPPTSLYGRLGSDTFGFCFSSREFDADMAEKYMSEFLISKENITHKVVIHEGVYEVTERQIDVSVMFDRAKIALETIKGDYKKHIALYDDAMREKALLDQTIALEIPAAIETGQIRPYLQAIVDKDGKVIGAEALVRWIHPVRGFITPGDFIPVVEQNGMIADVDRYMWQCAAGILKRWASLGRDDLFVSVNVSPKDFYFMDVCEELLGIVGQYGIPGSRLRIEITETVMMNDNAGKFEILRRLQESGFVVEMDDFGSGYSSLNMLRNMPVDMIKIDMMFINDMQNLTRTATILRNVINMMSELGLEPITEGIETEEQYRILSRMGCNLFQGYLFAKPMPVEEFEKRFLAVGEG